MHQPTLSSPEQAELRQYRNVSRLAIVALLVGLLSPVALAHPLLWVMPIAGVVLGVGALISLALHREELTGQRMATWGLILSLFFGAWSIGQVSLRGWLLQSQAQELADHWLSLWKAGQWEQVHQLSVPSTQRQPEGTDLQLFYDTDQKRKDLLLSFYAAPPNRWLKQMHDREGSFRFHSVEKHSHDTAWEDNFVLLYDVTVPHDDDQTEYRIRIHLSRKVYQGLDMVDWYISDTTDPNAKKF